MSEYITDKIKLEVEAPAAALPNLAPNPNGALGGWGWETPFVNNYLDGVASVKQRIVTLAMATGPMRVQTEKIQVAAGQYAGARFDTASTSSAGYFRAYFGFYTSDDSLVSTTTPSAYTAANVNATIYVGAQLAPATTAYVRLIIDFYSTNLGANPTTGQHLDITNVMVTKGATAGAVGEVRTNLISNNSFETNTTGWSVYSNGAPGAAITRSTTQAFTGTASMRAGGNFTWGAEASFTAVAAKTYIASAYFRAVSANTQVRVQIVWTTASGDTIEQSTAPIVTNAGWTRVSVSGTAPNGVTAAKIRVVNPAVAGSDVFYVDGVVVEEGSTLNAYYTGTYSNASYAFVDPYNWQEITDPSTHMQIHTEELGVGTMDVSIYSKTLDPSIGDTLQGGKRIRLSVFTGGVWVVKWTGKIVDPSVTYQPDPTGANDHTTSISLTCVDAGATLAGTPQVQGYETIPNLPYMLEGKGVPWQVNSDTGHNYLPAPTVAATNPNASVMDQVAITRDTARGYAWIDRNGVLQVKDRANMSTSSVATFSDALGATQSYTNIDASWSTKDVINTVTVKYQRYNIGTGQTTEVTYPLKGGAYTDAASVAKYGPRSAEYTYQSVTESEAAITTFANNILTANATPIRKPNSLTYKVKGATSLANATAIGLYDTLTVVVSNKLSVNVRVTSIDYDITPEGWTVTYGFGAAANAGGAAPTLNTPSPTVSSAAEAGWQIVGSSGVAFTAGWGNFAAGTYTPARYKKVDTTLTIEGLVSRSSGTSVIPFSLPPGYRPLLFTVTCGQTNGTASRMDINNATGDLAFPNGVTTGGFYSVYAVLSLD